jgi:hypothetical protein
LAVQKATSFGNITEQIKKGLRKKDKNRAHYDDADFAYDYQDVAVLAADYWKELHPDDPCDKDEVAYRWQELRLVTLPMLLPTTTFVVLMTLIGHFQLFAEPYVMTQGGPEDSTRSIVLLLYEQGFRWWNLGQASAIAVLLFAVVLAGTLLARLWREREGSA